MIAKIYAGFLLLVIIGYADVFRNSCGYPYKCAVVSGNMSNSSFSGYRVVYIYYLNKTAERMKSEGYEVKIHKVDLGDVLMHVTYTKGNFKETLKILHPFAVAPAGGEPAEPERAQYMAQLGEKKADETRFLCDGVLINRQWVLTAAHCFFSSQYDINFLRLGDYDISVPPSPHDKVHGKHIEDYTVGEVVIHPEYNPKVRYHDLALVPLPRKTPNNHPSINPICLPWEYINQDFRGKEVVLTGWGATQFGAPKTALLQQVKLKVYDTKICMDTYSKLPRFGRKHPEGLPDDKIMCVGWDEAGKDACNGDSGAPIVIGKNFSIYNDFVLAAIVSGGFGCGLKEYPGLYIPVNQPKYLRWIKKVAFKDFE